MRYHKRQKYCIRGHERSLYGVGHSGQCRECDRIWHQKKSHEKAATNPRSWLRAAKLTQLRGVRQELGITQRELARLSGFGKSYISKLESGACGATVDAQQKLLAALCQVKAKRREDKGRMERAGLR